MQQNLFARVYKNKPGPSFRITTDPRSFNHSHEGSFGTIAKTSERGDPGMLLDGTVYFVAAKKYLPIKANHRVAYEK